MQACAVSPCLPLLARRISLLASRNSPCLPQLACGMQPTTLIPACNLQVGDACNLPASYHLQPSNLEASKVQGMQAGTHIPHATCNTHTSRYLHEAHSWMQATSHIPRSVVALTLAPSCTSLRMVRACTRSSQPTNRLSAPAAAKCCAAPSASVSVLLY
jgi:hypothetical protein